MRLTAKNFEKEVLMSDKPVLVEFWASWCPPCKMMEPILHKLEMEYEGKVKICTINVDLNPKIAAKFKIMGVPTFILFKDGREVYRDVAAKSEEQLREIIENALKGKL